MIRELLNRLFPDRRPVMDDDEIERHQEATRNVLRSQTSIRNAEKVIKMLEAQASADSGTPYEGRDRRLSDRDS